MPARLFLAVDQPWVDWGWLSTHVPYVWDAVVQHLELTVVAVVVGLAISLVLGVLAHLWRPLRFPVLTVFGAFYTIPSIALFALLIPITGLSGTSAEIPLIGYNVLILVRNVMVGLDAVPAEVLDAADGMGYRRFARLVAVELPLAVPAIIAGFAMAFARLTRACGSSALPVAISAGMCLTRLRLKSGLDPALPERHIVLAGARDLDPLEQDLLDRSAVERLSVEDIKTRSASVASQMKRLEGLTDVIYVHVDMDVLDPKEVAGHPLTVPNGPTSLELAAALTEMFRHEKAAAFGVASTPSGDHDRDGLSRKAAYNLILAAVRGLQQRGSPR